MSEYANLEAIFTDWLDAHRRGDLEAIARRVHPDAVYQGVRPELACPDREAIVASPVPAGNCLLVRTDRSLYCITARKS